MTFQIENYKAIGIVRDFIKALQIYHAEDAILPSTPFLPLIGVGSRRRKKTVSWGGKILCIRCSIREMSEDQKLAAGERMKKYHEARNTPSDIQVTPESNN